MSAAPAALEIEVELEALGALRPISRSGGQGRVYAPDGRLLQLASATVVKLYRSRPPASAALSLAEMVAWSHELAGDQRRQLHRVAAWPLATVTAGGGLAGIVMQDLRPRFELPFLMPSGRVANVMLQLEHLLGADDYLQQRGLPIALDTRARAAVAERICEAFAFLHRHAIAVSDVSPSNLLISFPDSGPQVCLIDCDSMVFRGRQALHSVETGDWQMPATFAEPPLTRAADAYKLGLVLLRLFARSTDARELDRHERHVPVQLRPLLARALSHDASNRPPAGEWQLALRRVLADEQLGRSHPGPAPPVRAPIRRGVPRAREHPAPARVAARSGAGGPGAARLAGARQAALPARGVPRGLTVAWLIAGVLLLIVFMQLLQSAALVPQSGGLAGNGREPLRSSGGSLYPGPQAAGAERSYPYQAEEGPAVEPDTQAR